MSWAILQADARQIPMKDQSVDVIVTDPPYGLEFMGKEWDRIGHIGKVSHTGPRYRDGSTVFGRQRVAYNGSSNIKCRSCGKWKWGHMPGDGGGGGLRCQCDNPDFPSSRPDQAKIMQEWHYSWAIEALRVLKPGGYLLAFGGTRTFHRLTCAIEDAGFEIRDCIMWLYGSGFPKGSRVNRDPRFCQCGDAARSAVSNSLGQVQAVRSDKAVAVSDDVLRRADVQHSTRTQSNLTADCLPVDGFCDGLSLEARVSDQESVPQSEYALERNRSVSHEDVPASESCDNPSLVQYTFRSPDEDEERKLVENKTSLYSERESTDDDRSHDSNGHMLCSESDSASSYPTYFPICSQCKKQNVDGWNVALKPSYEPIVISRKPIEKTLAYNVQKWGVGAMNIDECRITLPKDDPQVALRDGKVFRGHGENEVYSKGIGRVEKPYFDQKGRWPSNILLSHHPSCQQVGFKKVKNSSGGLTGLEPSTPGKLYGGFGEHKKWQAYADEDGNETVENWNCHESCPVRLLDEQSGERPTGKPTDGHVATTGDIYGQYANRSTVGGGDTGGASRFFYTAKADNQDRGEGNTHPTVKPQAIIEYLLKLVSRPGSIVLDMFAGSGTTILVADKMGRHGIGLDNDKSHVRMAYDRCFNDAPLLSFGSSQPNV